MFIHTFIHIHIVLQYDIWNMLNWVNFSTHLMACGPKLSTLRSAERPLLCQLCEQNSDETVTIPRLSGTGTSQQKIQRPRTLHAACRVCSGGCSLDIEHNAYHVVSCVRSICKWLGVNIMAPFWFLNVIRHLLFRGPKKGTIILTTTQIGITVIVPHHSLRRLRSRMKPGKRASSWRSFALCLPAIRVPAWIGGTLQVS